MAVHRKNHSCCRPVLTLSRQLVLDHPEATTNDPPKPRKECDSPNPRKECKTPNPRDNIREFSCEDILIFLIFVALGALLSLFDHVLYGIKNPVPPPRTCIPYAIGLDSVSTTLSPSSSSSSPSTWNVDLNVKNLSNTTIFYFYKPKVKIGHNLKLVTFAEIPSFRQGLLEQKSFHAANGPCASVSDELSTSLLSSSSTGEPLRVDVMITATIVQYHVKTKKILKFNVWSNCWNVEADVLKTGEEKSLKPFKEPLTKYCKSFEYGYTRQGYNDILKHFIN